jgi:hypothetical protein
MSQMVGVGSGRFEYWFTRLTTTYQNSPNNTLSPISVLNVIKYK